MSNPTTTRVTATREVYTHHGEAAVTIEFYKSNIINIERITLDGARVLRQQLDDFLAEADIAPGFSQATMPDGSKLIIHHMEGF